MSIEQIERRTRVSSVCHLLAITAGLAGSGCHRTFRNRERRAPLVPQYVQADAAVAVDVGVVDAGGEVDLRRLEGVVCWEVYREEEDTAGVR